MYVSRLVSLIADTASEEVNPCRAMDVIVFVDSECLSVVGRHMSAVGQDATPIPCSNSPKSDGLSPQFAQCAKRTRAASAR